MALRRKATAPRTEIQVLNERIDSLAQQVKQLRQASTSTLQAEPITRVGDPVPFQTIVNVEGTHSEATDSSGLVYYHPGDEDVGGPTAAGWKAVGGEVRPWISVYDDFYWGQGINTSSSGDNLQFPYCDWSDSASGVFSYTRSASTLGAPNNYNPKILVNGVYSFTIWEIAQFAPAEYSVNYYIDMGATDYPGRKTGQSDLQNTIYVMDDTSRWSGPDFFWFTSFVMPITVPVNGGTVYPWIRVGRPAAVSNFSLTLRNRLWITYLGPLGHAAGFVNNNDPYPTTP